MDTSAVRRPGPGLPVAEGQDLRIAHIVPSYLPAVRYGGPIVSVHGLCRALVRRGHEVQVFTTNIDGPLESAVPLAVPVDVEGVRVRYFPVPAFRRLYWSPRLLGALRDEMGTFDLMHTHSVFLWPTWAAARAASHGLVPYVLSPRGMLVKNLVRRKSRWTKEAWIRAIEAGNIERASAIHVTSQLEADELVRFGFRLPAVCVIPNGVDRPVAERGAENPSSRIDALATGSRYLLYIGRVNWKKGLDRLIEAMVLVPGIRLIVAGNDEDGYQPTLDAIGDRLGVSGRIEFAGPVYGADKQLLLRHAAALVVPSYSENFGNVVLEAMAAGCPVVTTPEVGSAAIVRECRAGIVVEGDPRAFSAGIDALLADPEEASAMGLRGKEAVAMRYTWDAAAASMESLYNRVRTVKP